MRICHRVAFLLVGIGAAFVAMAVVDGFTPQGPLIVTWGHTLQMTWEQWNAEVVSMWGISTA